jgi:hypothetical protein
MKTETKQKVNKKRGEIWVEEKQNKKNLQTRGAPAICSRPKSEAQLATALWCD